MMKSYEERVKSVLSRWMGGENLREASRLMAEMAKEESDASFSSGYAFAKEETKKITELVETLSD